MEGKFRGSKSAQNVTIWTHGLAGKSNKKVLKNRRGSIRLLRNLMMTAVKHGTRSVRVVSPVVWHRSRFVAFQKGKKYDEIIGCNQRCAADQ